jgi:hypothetical protein
MKPATHTLSDLFGSDVQYVVPLYQRPYVWKQDTHWMPLWQDLVEIVDHQLDPATGAPSHFLGAVVLDQIETTPGEATKRLVIDGQQRLTTLQLLLTAAAEECEKAGAEREARLLRRLTRNSEDLTSGDARYKVWPTNANQPAFRAVMSANGGDPGADDRHNTIHEAHAFFRRAIRAWSREGSPGTEVLIDRFAALRVALDSLLFVVSINLESGDNAQVIFETLNARGTPLLAMDLVKNGVFYRAAQAGVDTDSLHTKVWEPELGLSYWRESRRQGRLNRPRAELFLMHWLAMKLGRIIPATELFSEFRSHVLDRTPPDQIATLIRELCRDAAVLRSFDDQAPGTVQERFFRTLDALDTTTVLPLALLLFRSLDVSDESRSRALAAVESWLVRRMLTGLTTKNYNKVGADLLAVARMDLRRADELIIGELASSDVVTQVWPRDSEMVRVLVTRHLYGWVAQRRIVMVLSAVELERRRSSNKTEAVFVLPPNLTVEHVMPQRWRQHWSPLTASDESDPLEAARDHVIHHLGNLTLTSGPLNSSLSNGPWGTKREALRNHSLLLLNAELSGLGGWDVTQINQRGYNLAAEICRIWPSPTAFCPPRAEETLPALEQVLAAVSAPSDSAAPGRGGIRIADLLAAGYIEDGETLYPVRKHVSARAVVLGDGRLECEEGVYETPSAAAKAAAGTVAENGWQFWRVERGGEYVSLSDVRTQMAGASASSEGSAL